ncbi:S1 family peptidase [Prauserella muralis]|uniref:Serine protease n=1 Tax=Prauserella muralis TaxID=588067 RepID=A0A2V4BC25_9PSEU|nr:serine protease [Prauserella muralis]PXY27179.1 serine protease [Prauserella muralis]TWE23169.1 chymotrypsin [Prauserella muralis]
MSTKLRHGLVAGAVLLLAAVFVPLAMQGRSSGVQPNIVGGKEVAVADHPYAVFLVDGRGNQFCGGTLVAADTVLTAAHCAVAVDSSDLGVVAGRQDKDAADGMESAVRRVSVAPEYEDPTTGNDIAVLELARDLPYRPARMAGPADQALYAPGTMATVLGWGRLSDGGPRSDTLRGAQVPLVDDRTCGTAYGTYDPHTMVCAGYPEGGVDACQGDSGGPLMVGNTLIGIVSWGQGCAAPGKPGVYTRVATYAGSLSGV